MKKYNYLIFRNYGKFGNQIFQYAALKMLAKNNKNIICYGFEDFQVAFDNIDVRIINDSTPVHLRIFYNFLYWLADFLSNKKIICRAKEVTNKIKIFRAKESKGINKTRFIETKGLFNNLVFIDKSYFQSEKYFDAIDLKSLQLKPELLEYGSGKIRSVSGDNIPIFVHIRRSDFAKWPTSEYPAILPASYYRRCINIIKQQIDNPFFIFTSDDIHYVHDVFADIENSHISTGTGLEDFALMSQCRGGILSASSFAWWAAYFSNSNYSQTIFLAPKYWGGCRLQKWYPPSVKSSFLEYIEI